MYFSRACRKTVTSKIARIFIPSYNYSVSTKIFIKNKTSHKILLRSSTYSFSSSSLIFSLQSNLSEDQLEIQNLGLEFMEKELKPHAKEWDIQKRISYQTFRKAADLGFCGLYISPDFNGLGFNRFDSCLIFEALAQGCVSTTALLTIHNMTAWMLDTYGSHHLKSQYLSSMVESDLIGSYCLTETHCGSDSAALKTYAKIDESDNNYYIINGSKAFITGANVHHLYFVMCRTGARKTSDITCFLIPKDTPGLSFGANEIKMGWNGSPTGMVFLDNCRIHKDFIVGNVGEGFKIAMKALDGGRLGIASCSLGAAHRCLEDAIKYAMTREAFDKKLCVFQSIQFEVSELATDLHCSRLLLRDSCQKFDENHEESSMFCAMAKKKVTDVGFQICDRSLQIFGGYGYLAEFEIERFVRDCRVHKILEGTNEIMNVIISKRILDPLLNGF